MRIKEITTQAKAVAVEVMGFIRRHPRASMAVAAALLIAGPLLTGNGGEAFFLNLAGMGIAALVVRRFVQTGKRRKQANWRCNCRCHCHRKGRQISQQAILVTPSTPQTQQPGGTP